MGENWSMNFNQTIDPLARCTEDRSRVSRRRAIHSGMALLSVAAMLSLGCEKMPQASSRETVRVLAALRTALSTRDSERLREVRQRVEMMQRQESLTEAEHTMLLQIMSTATAGDWEDAEQLCARFQKAQIR